jgi:hypothetical protein
MKLEPKRKVEMPFWGLNSVLAISAFGWLLASFLLGKIQPGEISQTASAIGVSLFEAILIGTSVGIAVNLYLKHALGETPKSILEKGNIDTIYTSRQSAEDDFKRLIQDRKKMRRLDIIGASLRDFLMPTGPLREVWTEIERRLADEHRKNIAPDDRLHVRLLLLDPQSSEGLFRHKVESSTIKSDGLPKDVEQGMTEVSRVQQKIYGDRPQVFLQARLYEHCPFAFMLITEAELYVQQYDYRDHRTKSVMPFIKYLHDTQQYNELEYSFETIWKYAASVRPSEHNVGTAAAIEQANLKNIFRKRQRRSLGGRQTECIVECRDYLNPGDTIDILAITGNFYVSDFETFKTLREMAAKGEGSKGITVRLAIVNPVSQQAILRAVADSSPTTQIGEYLKSWSWTKHKNSELYQDAHRTINVVRGWMDQCSFQIRLYSSSISCALLLTPRSKFIEQYVYGRSTQFREQRALGGEYPVFEYEMSEGEGVEKIEQEILSSTFDVIWDHYSIEVDDYKVDEEEEFKKNLQRLLEELNPAATSPAREYETM